MKKLAKVDQARKGSSASPLGKIDLFFNSAKEASGSSPLADKKNSPLVGRKVIRDFKEVTRTMIEAKMKEGKITSTITDSFLDSAFIELLKGQIVSIGSISLFPSDLSKAVEDLKDVSRKELILRFLISFHKEDIVTSEYIVRDIIKLAASLPDDRRAALQGQLKAQIISAYRWHILDKQLARFVDEILPCFRFSFQEELQIATAHDIAKRLSKMPENVIASQKELLDHVRGLKSSSMHFAEPILKNIITYLYLHPPSSENAVSEKEITAFRVIEASMQEAIFSIKESYRIYGLLRWVAKITLLSSNLVTSLIDRIDQLCRIAEREVNVSTHKGQDLLSPADLQKVLTSGHQRGRTGPGNTFDPEVTKALTELLQITGELSGSKAGIVSITEMYAFDEQRQKAVEKAIKRFIKGEISEALLDLTALRRSILTQYIAKMKKAVESYYSDIRRWGPHIDTAKKEAAQALKLMEMDIILEQKINDHSGVLFKSILAGIEGEEHSSIISQAISAVYIIAENASLSGFGQDNLSRFAHSLFDMASLKKYAPLEVARIFGLVAQIKSLVTEEIELLQQDFKARVETMDRKRGMPKEEAEDSPASLAFVQDLLRTTTVRQFGERVIFTVEKIMRERVTTHLPGFSVDPVVMRDVARVANIQWLAAKGAVLTLEESKKMRPEEIGAKCYGLGVMDDEGLPVPDAFIVMADERRRTLPHYLRSEIKSQIASLEERTGKKLGDAKNPLLLSLRAGFRVSMPGVFATVSNVGMNKKVMESLAKDYDEKFALECYTRFIRSYYDMVIDVFDPSGYEVISRDIDLGSLRKISKNYEAKVSARNIEIPEDPWEQIEAIVDYIMYHSIGGNIAYTCASHGMPKHWALFVIVQEMVFGNLDGSYTAVVYTRNTKDGSANLEVEMLPEAQGEDLVSDGSK